MFTNKGLETRRKNKLGYTVLIQVNDITGLPQAQLVIGSIADIEINYIQYNATAYETLDEAIIGLKAAEKRMERYYVYE